MKGRQPMYDETPDNDNEADGSHTVAASELRSFVERIERLEAEKKEIADQIKEVKAEAKARGYSLGPLSRLLAERKRDQDDLAEEEAILQMYRDAIGR